MRKVRIVFVLVEFTGVEEEFVDISDLNCLNLSQIKVPWRKAPSSIIFLIIIVLIRGGEQVPASD